MTAVSFLRPQLNSLPPIDQFEGEQENTRHVTDETQRNPCAETIWNGFDNRRENQSVPIKRGIKKFSS